MTNLRSTVATHPGSPRDPLFLAARRAWALGLACAVAACADTTMPPPGGPLLVVGPPAMIAARVGKLQAGTVATEIGRPPSVIVTDAAGNPVSGVAIAFDPAIGGGVIGAHTAVTDSNGMASPGAWALGLSAGLNVMTATAPGLTLVGDPVSFFAMGAVQPSGFHIEVRPLGSLTATQSQIITNAIARWQAVIVEGHLPVTLTVPNGLCGPAPEASETVDDLLIYLQLDNMDGRGGILAATQPCVIASLFRPIVARIHLDALDLIYLQSSGQLENTIAHEIGHALGFGVMWPFHDLVEDPAGPLGLVTDTHFTGSGALAGFDLIGGLSYSLGAKVPVENLVPGSLNAHWRESVLGSELMTSVLDAGPNPLSALTVRSMEDMGYTIDAGAAEPFSLALGVAARGGVPAAPIHLENDLLPGPAIMVDSAGRTIRTFAP